MITILPKPCPQCGQLISGGLKGLCPKCLALVAFEPEKNAQHTEIAEPRGEADLYIPAPFLSSTARYFGDYELIEEIARGGMGVVFKARQTGLNRMVAVKMILAGQLASPSDVKRFHSEAEAAANLQHPNIVAIHESGEHEGRHYFSMDLVEGQNLAELLNRQPMEPGRAAAMLKTIAEAVHYAHQRGTIHRDLKPQNILIDSSGNPRVTDFGLAKRIETKSDLTQSGAIMGSPSYMPPEQAAGRQHEVGPCSDVYSLGAILYQMLAGRAPFEGENSAVVLNKVFSEEPPRPSKHNPRIPADLETICLKCLEKKPERRYATAQLLAEELERFLTRKPILARPPHPLRRAWNWGLRNPWLIAATVTAALLGVVGFAYGLWQENAYLAWKSAHPGQTPGYNPTFLDSSYVIYLTLLGAMTFANFPWFDLMTRRRRGDPIRNTHLAAYSFLGLVEVSLGIVLTMKWAEAEAWKWPTLYVPHGSPTTLVGAYSFASFGILLLWETARERLMVPLQPIQNHPPGLKRNSLNTLFRGIADAAGLSNRPCRLGFLEFSRGALVIGFMFSTILACTWLVTHGQRWGLEAMVGWALGLGMVICFKTKNEARLYWLVTLGVMAGMTLVH